MEKEKIAESKMFDVYQMGEEGEEIILKSKITNEEFKYLYKNE